MSIWLRFGDRSIRWDGRLPGGLPVLVPPAWALVERIWETIDAPRGPAWIEPDSWSDQTIAALPAPQESHRLCLVVPDATRSGAFLALIPPLLRRLGDLPFAERTLLVATGTHRPVSVDELRAHWTRHETETIAWDRWRLVQNSEDRFERHREVGRTKQGTPVRIHPAYLDADVRIVVGEVTHHYFAGYGGASKMIFPGIADPEGAMRNHRLALVEDGAQRWNDACAPGRVERNPVAQDLAEAARLAPAAWAVIADPRPPANPDPATPTAFPVRVLQGWTDAPDDPVDEARCSLDARGTVVFTRAPDLLIVDAGGAPRDATFLQAHKSLQHAVRFVPPGGSILWIARCQEGFGSRALESLASREPLSPGTVSQGSRVMGSAAGAELHAQTIRALQRAVAHARVALWSELPSDQVARLGIEPLESENAALDWVKRAPGRFWGWLPRAERFVPASGWRGGNLTTLD